MDLIDKIQRSSHTLTVVGVMRTALASHAEVAMVTAIERMRQEFDRTQAADAELQNSFIKAISSEEQRFISLEVACNLRLELDELIFDTEMEP